MLQEISAGWSKAGALLKKSSAKVSGHGQGPTSTMIPHTRDATWNAVSHGRPEVQKAPKITHRIHVRCRTSTRTAAALLNSDQFMSQSSIHVRWGDLAFDLSWAWFAGGNMSGSRSDRACRA